MAEERLEVIRSRVRRWVTYGAAAFIFGVGAVLIGLLLLVRKDALGDVQAAKDLFLAILPLATSVITYWFATRRPKEGNANGNEGDDKKSPTNNEEPEN